MYLGTQPDNDGRSAHRKMNQLLIVAHRLADFHKQDLELYFWTLKGDNCYD
jgi:hypothetical protein